MKQMLVQIMGQAYTLACPEDSEQAMEQAVQKVDMAMCKIRDAGKIRARDRIAVLSALNIAFEQQEHQSSANPANASNVPSSTSMHQPHAELLHPRLQLLLQRMNEVLTEDGKLL